MYNAVTIEDRDKPTVTLVNENFMPDARSAALIKGMPNLRVVSQTAPCQCTFKEIIEPSIIAVMDDVITGLTKPLTAEEESPKQQDTEILPRIAFKGNLEEVNHFFYKRGWSDGIPIIPPTEKAVEAMLGGTDLPPDYEVAKIVSRFGKATVEKIAINAVMAGALPTYMPLLIAGVEAVADPASKMGWAAVGTGSHTPFWIINGPIRNALNINSSSGYLSPGRMANAAIGRAMSLIIKNIGGNRPGIEDMGVHGNSGKFSKVAAENEEESPWEPLHVEHGFNKEDSTISFFCPNSYAAFHPYDIAPKGILNSVIYNITPGRWGLTSIMLAPVDAKTLARGGWTKKDIASFISEYATVPAYHHPQFLGEFRTGTWRGDTKIGRMPLNPTDPVRILYDPGWIRIIVAGGPGNYVGIHQAKGGGATGWVTKKAKLPANWDKLVSKYKNLTPMHLRY